MLHKKYTPRIFGQNQGCASLATEVLPPAFWAKERYQATHVNTWNLDSAIAAAEVVAAIQGHPGPDIPEEVNEWVRRYHPVVDEYILESARRVVARALATYELGNMWAGLSEYEAWRKVLENIQLRLQT